MHKRYIVAFSAALVASVSLLTPARAADVSKEIMAAAQHAGLAAKGGDIDEVHTHLHHTLNCLVGPEGKGFAPKELNPCKPLGNGAIPDAQDDATRKTLAAAAEKTEAGIAEADYATAQKTAGEIEAMLKAAE